MRAKLGLADAQAGDRELIEGVLQAAGRRTGWTTPSSGAACRTHVAGGAVGAGARPVPGPRGLRRLAGRSFRSACRRTGARQPACDAAHQPQVRAAQPPGRAGHPTARNSRTFPASQTLLRAAAVAIRRTSRRTKTRPASRPTGHPHRNQLLLMTYPDPENRRRMEGPAGREGRRARRLRGHAPRRHRAALHRQVRARLGRRQLPLHLLRRQAVRLGHQVRRRLRLAQLLAGGAGRDQGDPRRQPRHGPHRDGVRAMRRPPGPRVPRRPRPNRPALLHELRLAGLPARQEDLNETAARFLPHRPVLRAPSSCATSTWPPAWRSSPPSRRSPGCATPPARWSRCSGSAWASSCCSAAPPSLAARRDLHQVEAHGAVLADGRRAGRSACWCSARTCSSR